jgi:hypothetical protein
MGAISGYVFSDIGSDHSISASFKSAAVLPFTDVNSGDWFYDAVSYAYAGALFQGTSETSFSPGDTMPRGMFVTVLGRLAGVPQSYTGGRIGVITGEGVNIRGGPSTEEDKVATVSNRFTAVQVLDESGGWYQVRYGANEGYIRNDLLLVYDNNYSDLPLDQYYSVFTQWACITGVADGAASSAFDASSDISREDMALMLYNFIRIYGKNLSSDIPPTVFSDEGQMGALTRDAIYALQRAGVISGMGDGSYAPKSSATRAHVAQIFCNFASAIS